MEASSVQFVLLTDLKNKQTPFTSTESGGG